MWVWNPGLHSNLRWSWRWQVCHFFQPLSSRLSHWNHRTTNEHDFENRYRLGKVFTDAMRLHRIVFMRISSWKLSLKSATVSWNLKRLGKDKAWSMRNVWLWLEDILYCTVSCNSLLLDLFRSCSGDYRLSSFSGWASWYGWTWFTGTYISIIGKYTSSTVTGFMIKDQGC